MTEASINMAALLGALDSREFRPRPNDVTRGAIDMALEKGWVERQTSRPGPGAAYLYRLTPSGEKIAEFYLR